MHQRSPLYPTPGALASSTSEISHDQYGKELVELFEEEGTVGELWEAVGQPWATVCSFPRELHCLPPGENLSRPQARDELCPTGKPSPVSFPSIHAPTSVQRLAVSRRQHCLVFSSWAKHYDTLCLNLLLHIFTAKQHTFQLDSMSSDRKGKARAHSPILPESGQSASEQLSHPASGHAQATQVTESSRNLGVPTTPYGQAQAYSLPQAAASGQLKYNEIADPVFEATDDYLIFRFVAEGWDFDQIKNEKFPNRNEVTPALLESHAQTIGALWTKQEDDRLSAMEELEEIKEYDDLVRLRMEHFSNPAREGRDIQSRYNYLKRWREQQGAGGQAPAGRAPNGQRHSALDENPGGQASGSSDQQTHPSTPVQASVQTAASTQGLAGTSISSTPTSGDDSAAHPPVTPHTPGTLSQAQRLENNAEHKRVLVEKLPEIKLKITQGWTWSQVNAEYCMDYNCEAMRRFLRRRDCYVWSKDQSQDVMRFRRAGHNWDRISQLLPPPKRTPEEVEARFHYLEKNPLKK